MFRCICENGWHVGLFFKLGWRIILSSVSVLVGVVACFWCIWSFCYCGVVSVCRTCVCVACCEWVGVCLVCSSYNWVSSFNSLGTPHGSNLCFFFISFLFFVFFVYRDFVFSWFFVFVISDFVLFVVMLVSMFLVSWFCLCVLFVICFRGCFFVIFVFFFVILCALFIFWVSCLIRYVNIVGHCVCVSFMLCEDLPHVCAHVVVVEWLIILKE